MAAVERGPPTETGPPPNVQDAIHQGEGRPFLCWWEELVLRGLLVKQQ